VANYTIASGNVGKYELSLTANTEDIVDFPRDLSTVEVKCLTGTAPIYVSFGTVAATVKGDQCYDVPPGTMVQIPVRTDGNTRVRLISSAAATYSVSST
jgi:hypothetical protein